MILAVSAEWDGHFVVFRSIALAMQISKAWLTIAVFTLVAVYSRVYLLAITALYDVFQTWKRKHRREVDGGTVSLSVGGGEIALRRGSDLPGGGRAILIQS